MEKMNLSLKSLKELNFWRINIKKEKTKTKTKRNQESKYFKSFVWKKKSKWNTFLFLGFCWVCCSVYKDYMSEVRHCYLVATKMLGFFFWFSVLTKKRWVGVICHRSWTQPREEYSSTRTIQKFRETWLLETLSDYFQLSFGMLRHTK